MIFQPSWFILYLIFSINSIVFYEIFYNEITASRDVTYLFTNPDEISTAYVKLNSKHNMCVRIFRFNFQDNYDYSFHIYIKYDRGFTDRDEVCIAYVKSNSKHILFLRIFLFTIYFSNYDYNYDYNVIHTYIYIYILAPFWGGSGTRSLLIFWDTFPRYLRILFH